MYQTRFNGKRLTVEDYNRMHTYCLGFIKKSVAESTANHIVVVTHHLPTLQVVADSRIDVWVYGHSHTNIDTIVGNTKVVSNQMGYIFENEHLCNGFDAGKFIEI